MPERLAGLLFVFVCGTASAVSLGPGVASSRSAQDVQFADWRAVAANVATGTVRGTSIALSGPHVPPPPTSDVDGTSTLFDQSYFTPPIALR